VLGVLVALALSLGAAGALFSPLLDLDHIEIRGVEGAMEADVAEAAGVSPGEAMVAIDTEEVSSRIEELPSVAHADASLDWSGAMVLKVSPHRPAAFLAVGEEDALHVLTRAGEVVPVGAIETEGMPVFRLAAPIDGLDRHDRLALVTLVDSLDGLYGLSLGDMVAEPGDRYVFAGVGVIEGAEIDLGGLDDLVAKTQALEAMLGGDVDLRCLSRLDVSVPSRVTLLRDAACVERTYAPSPDSSAGAEDR
jgi:hypothetical protein